ncbi:uncharacterized protein K444DRAFT_663093 [Hyaloscypha bicolor E]|uniref:F-box domain-containing protein n=1 Tax=Hyaloscypha bicolor E TaxID=1095630 RepID=A0A2J6TCI4_9HELO|nr:uncharacterized protein K444DRAFT_663093 [Hyaloscypha bicolor E]PMD60736.1 hypothetical protein K444DRAFT_663093 [Hyaloscypha bicolor E]
MPIQRQSHLGRTPGGQLYLQKPQRARAAESVEPYYISVLPDEVLFEILSYIPPKRHRYELVKDEERFPLTLMLVCKKWRRIYEPVLFRTIMTHYHTTIFLSRMRGLLDLLYTRPHLRGYPRNICISISRTVAHAAVCRILSAVIKCCTGLRVVSFHSVYIPDISEHLDLGGPSLQLFFRDFTLPSLKSLYLSRYGPGRNPEDTSAPWPGEPISITRTGLEHLLPPNRYHTGNVTKVLLRDPSCLQNVTEHILRWPSALTDLSIWLSHSTGGKYYTMEATQRILDIHRSSLKRVTIGMLSGGYVGRTGSPDFSSFLHLEELGMSAYNLIRSETATDAARKLSAPNLRCVTLSFSVEDQHSESRSDFGKEQVTWIQEFAKLKEEKYPVSKLEKMVVLFDPNENPYHLRRLLRGPPEQVPVSEIAEPLTWPWEYLEEAKQCAAEFELRVEFKAGWTREEWDRVVKDEKVEMPDVLEDLQPGLDGLFFSGKAE